jgi:hypothetical protein
VVKRLFLAALVAVVPSLALAQQASSGAPVADDAVKAVAQAALDTDDVDVSQNIQDQIQTYLDKSGLRERQRRHEIEILTATAAVEVPSTSRDWVMQRSAAYEEALLEAESDYVKQQGLRITDEEVSRVFKAGDQTPPPYDTGQVPGKTAELVRKVVALANGKVDGELRAIGIDPTEYNAAPQPQRYLQMQNAMKRLTARQAVGELTGLVTAQTFEGQDGKGNYMIGVVAVVSPTMKDFARDVLTAHGNIAPDPARAQDLTRVYSDRKQLIPEFGVRRLFDSAGLPVLVSFAQWASGYSGSDPAVSEQYRRVAMEQAEARADAQIAQFLKGSMMVDSQSETGRTIEKAAERLPDGYVQDDAATKSVTDAMLRTLRSHSQVQVTGIETLYSWGAKHPKTGQKIVGVIRIWSAAGEKAVRQLRDQHGSAAAKPVAAPPNGTPSVTKGRDLMNASDF